MEKRLDWANVFVISNISASDRGTTTDPVSRLKGLERVAVEDILRALLESEYRKQAAGEAQLGALGGLDCAAGLRALARAREAGLADEAAQAW
jgi:hypothetical protein